MRTHGVIIIGGHVQGLGITRILGNLKIPIVVLDDTKISLARHSKYCQVFYKYPKNQLLNFLVNLGKSEKHSNFIVLPTNDAHVEILSKHKQILSQYFIVGTDNWNVIEKCYNKRKTYQLAKELQLPLADTYMPNSKDEINEIKINFPCVIKPAIMHTFYSHFKKKVFICNSKKELISNYKEAIKIIPAEEIIIQSIIAGDSENLYSACFLFDKQKAINYFVGRRARQHPPDFGNATTFAQIVDNEELIETSIKLLKHIGYKGVCEVEYKYDINDKKYKLLEINPRTWKWHNIAEKAEINLLENYYNLLTEKELMPQKKIKKASFRHLITDIPMVIKYKKHKIYKKYPRYPMQYAVWDSSDLLPTFFELIYLPFLIWKR